MCFFGVYRKGLSILTVFAFNQTLSISQTDGERKHKNKETQMVSSQCRTSIRGREHRKAPVLSQRKWNLLGFIYGRDKAQACQASV